MHSNRHAQSKCRTSMILEGRLLGEERRKYAIPVSLVDLVRAQRDAVAAGEAEGSDRNAPRCK
jgi:hypothetical protein